MSRDPAALRTAGLAAAVLVFSWPQLAVLARRETPSYPLLTAIFALLIVALVVTWQRRPVTKLGLQPPSDDERSRRGSSWLAPIAAAVAAIVIALAMYRWTREVGWQGHRADMLIVIREATRRFLGGQNPYTTYTSYDAPWIMVMPYGPAMWFPFLLPQLLHVDFRVVAIIGELFIPVWCGVAAIVESARGRIAGAASWLAVLAALLVTFDLAKFTLIGHTPVYWPLFPLFAAMAVRRRWSAAACLLGILVVARTTMVTLIPVLAMAVWKADRRRLPMVLTVLTITIAAALGPFILWDYRAIWDGMVASYPRVMKTVVWGSGGRGAIDTIGVTGSLLARHRESLVVPVQAVVMIGVYGLTWIAIRRGAGPLPWMALALLAFSMTTLWPVYYIYYDVLLLLVSGAMVEALEGSRASMAARPWLLSLAALVALAAASIRTVMSPFPYVAAGEIAPGLPLRAGFARSEHDGQRRFAWIVGKERRSSFLAAPRRPRTSSSPPNHRSTGITRPRE